MMSMPHLAAETVTPTQLGLHLLLLVFLAFSTFGVSASDPPLITTNPSNTTVELKTEIYLFCRVSGNPEPKIRWYKGRNLLKVNKKNSKHTITNYAFGSVLVYKRATSNLNNRKFTCKARNEVGEITSSVAIVKVIRTLPSGFPKIIEAPAVTVGELGQTVSVKCKARNSENLSIFWTCNNIPIDMSDSRYSIQSIGTLEIFRANDKDSGIYGCHAFNSIGHTMKSAELYMKTRKTPPRFVRPNNSSLKVVINPGDNYTVKCMAVGSPLPEITFLNGVAILSNTSMKGVGSLDIVNLRASTNYTCRARSILGEIKLTFQVIVRALPRPPHNLVVGEIRANSVKLSWKRVPSKTDQPYTYTVFYRIKDSAKSSTCTASTCKTKITNTNVLIDGLRVNTAYIFTVSSVSKVGIGKPSIAIIETTGQTKPTSPPLNVQATAIDDNTIKISWNEPIESNGNIVKYHVRYTLNNLSVSVPEMNLWTLKTASPSDSINSVNIYSLLIGRVYSIRVAAENDIGIGPYSDVIKLTTIVGKPETPQGFKGETISANSIRVSWAPAVTNVHIKHYFLYYKTKMRKFDRIKIASSQNEYELDILDPDTLYHLSLSCVTSSESEVTDFIQLRTFQKVPGKPRDIILKVVNSTALRVFWKKPLKSNGRIMSYNIEYSLSSSPSRLNFATFSHPTNIQMNYTISSLQPESTYIVCVIAVNMKGDGELSDKKQQMTLKPVPSIPQNLKLSISSESPPSIQVEWSKPQYIHGILKGYKLTYGKVLDPEDDRLSIVFNNVTKQKLIDKLDYGSLYEFRISAENQIGNGKYKSKSIQTPDGSQ